MATLYLTFGPTHSGKTTFSKKLYRGLVEKTKIILVDNDKVEEFVRDNFNNLRTDKEILATRTPTNPDLRLRIPQLIVEYALAENYNVIVSASHSKQVIREHYLEIAKRHHARTVLLMFCTSKEEVAKRIQRTERGMDLTLNAESYEELYQKQMTSLLERPSVTERNRYDEVIEINERNSQEILSELTCL